MPTILPEWIWFYIVIPIIVIIFIVVLVYLVMKARDKALERDFAKTKAGLMSLLGGSGAKGNPVCPKCGTIYNREVVISLLKQQDPLLSQFGKWTTKFVCKKCGEHIWISGG